MKDIFNKFQFLTALLFIVFLLLVTVAPANLAKAQWEDSNLASVGEDAFSIFHISDTQTLTNAPNRTYLFDQQSQWIINNSVYFNNKMVIHTGDIQDNGNVIDQWISANKSMSLLMNNAIPYLWCAGNHDLYPMEVANSKWLGCNYSAFNPSSFSTQAYWVSNFSDGKNTAGKFSYTNNGQIYNFLLVALEYDANSTVLTWMKDLIKAYPDYNVILGTHDYMNQDGTYTSYGAALSPILDTLPNIVMVLSGHMHNSTNPSQVAHKFVNGREEIEWDLQEYDMNGIGSADVQILTFNVTGATPTVYVNTFQTYAPTKYLTETGHTYNFSLTLQKTSVPIPTPTPTPTDMPSPTTPAPISFSYPTSKPLPETPSTSALAQANALKTTKATPLSTPIPTSPPSILPNITNTEAKFDITINGNATIQVASYKIATNQSADSTTLSFTANRASDTVGFENVTIPKSAIAYGKSPTIYIDNQLAQNQGFNQNDNNYNVWYTTHLNTHEVTILFTETSLSSTPPASLCQNQFQSLRQEAVYIEIIAVVTLAIIAVLLFLRYRRDSQQSSKNIKLRLRLQRLQL